MFFATFEHVYPVLEQSLEEFKTTLKENPETTKAREILNFGIKERKYAESMRGLANYKIRFIPREFETTHMDFIIFGEKVALVQTDQEIFATVLESQQLAAALRTLFEMAWRQAVDNL